MRGLRSRDDRCLATTNNPFRFSTKYLDQETGWYYYGYRYYSPEMGRWTRRDPLGDPAFILFLLEIEGDFPENDFYSLYCFVRNSPVGNRDLLGLSVWDDIKEFIRCIWEGIQRGGPSPTFADFC